MIRYLLHLLSRLKSRSSFSSINNMIYDSQVLGNGSWKSLVCFITAPMGVGLWKYSACFAAPFIEISVISTEPWYEQRD